ncbi:methylated-DNA--[protein]-cysteine S-methyltransferase [candidate division KSB1 bacterium]
MKISNKKTITLYYSTVKLTLGEFHTAATDRGVCAIAWSTTAWEKFLEDVKKHFNILLVRDSNRLKKVNEELEGYFSGKVTRFSCLVDLINVTEFERKVLNKARDIHWGSTISYGALAREAGSHGGARAAGNALGKNPVPIVIPCHRVIKSDGTLGGFTGGTDKKVFLLEHEGVDLFRSIPSNVIRV